MILDHFGWKRWEKIQNGQIWHSESFWTTLVGKDWKKYKLAKIGHSESLWTNLVGKEQKYVTEYKENCNSLVYCILILTFKEVR